MRTTVKCNLKSWIGVLDLDYILSFHIHSNLMKEFNYRYKGESNPDISNII